MKAYKIECRGTTYDCWGCAEWDFWHTYGTTIYSTKEKAEDAIKNLNTYKGDFQYRISEVDFE